MPFTMLEVMYADRDDCACVCVCVCVCLHVFVCCVACRCHSVSGLVRAWAMGTKCCVGLEACTHALRVQLSGQRSMHLSTRTQITSSKSDTSQARAHTQSLTNAESGARANMVIMVIKSKEESKLFPPPKNCISPTIIEKFDVRATAD
jgi:hypothetical protein